jgi:hypothetical protein
MSNFDYDPEDVGKSVVNSRGRIVVVRKYHLTEKEEKRAKEKFKIAIQNVPQSTKDKSGTKFFNPYRARGIYYAQIQTLYLLGANEWYSYNEVRAKMQEFASSVEIVRRDGFFTRKTNVWAEFERKTAKPNTVTSKDIFGRIHENMTFFQRLAKLHPYGYKLKQACAAVDIKRVSREGFPNGVFFYRLSTYKSPKKAIPIKDVSEFVATNLRGRKYGSRNKKKNIIGKTVMNPMVKTIDGLKV